MASTAQPLLEHSKRSFLSFLSLFSWSNLSRCQILERFALSLYPTTVLFIHFVRWLQPTPHPDTSSSGSGSGSGNGEVTVELWNTFLSYLKDPSNALNVYGMEYGWMWVSLVLLVNYLAMRRFETRLSRSAYTALNGDTASSAGAGADASAGADLSGDGDGAGASADDSGKALLIRFALATVYWLFITHVFFAPFNPLWPTGFKPSGHVFLISHGSLVLWYEVLIPFSASGRSHSLSTQPRRPGLIIAGVGAAAAAAAALVVGLFWFMLIFTNLYFHTFLECVMGLIAGYALGLPMYRFRMLYKKPGFGHDGRNGEDSEGESLAAFEQSSYSSV